MYLHIVRANKTQPTNAYIVVAHCDSFIDAPETPAPVFAVRAFKHAIFGTPRPAEVHDQFDDIAAKMTSDVSKHTTTERIPVPKHSQDGIKAMVLPDELGLSPSKPNGILMTPGTTRRNKTVSFGAQVVDNEGKKISRSGLPNTCPGKFPSPWTPKTDVDGLSETSTSTSTSTQKRTRLTQTLHEVRDSSKTRNQQDKIRPKSKDDLDITLDFMEPRSQSGKYWKQEYDAYAEKTQREVKKLLTKQKIAKEYAKDKDGQVVELTEQLRQEKSKTETLEARLKVLEVKGTARPLDDVKSAQNEAAKLRLENWKLREDLERAQAKTTKTQSSPRRRSAPPAQEDIWAEAILSSPFVAEVPEKSPKREAGFTSTSKKMASPLRSRDINTISSSQRRSRSKPGERTVDLTPKRNRARSTPRSARDSDVLPEDSIDMSLALPQPSPDLASHSPPRSARRTPRSARKLAAEKSINDMAERYSPTKSLIMSSPPPKFDRLALPVGMPSAKADTQQRNQRKKPSLMESFANAASPDVQRTNTDIKSTAFSAAEGKENVAEQREMAKPQKKTVTEERRIAALERIAARRAAGKTKA